VTLWNKASNGDLKPSEAKKTIKPIERRIPVIIKDILVNTLSCLNLRLAKISITTTKEIPPATIKNMIYEQFNRGGVTSMLVGPMAGTYIKGVMNFEPNVSGENSVEEGAFELGTIGKKVRVFQLPSVVVGDTADCLTLWKNPIENNDVTMACGVRFPLVSTGDIQRVNGYKEMGLARLEDLQVFMPKYLGRISISNIAEA
jgi:hypothetical protein